MGGIDPINFFKSPREHSEIKSEILNQYFKAWASILLVGQKKIPINSLFYIDLYAGQGNYDNNTPSTPIKILSSINENPTFNRSIKTFFNDNKQKIIKTLEKNILSLPFYNNLINKPVILNKDANINLLKNLIIQDNHAPALTFIDPLGYKGVSKELCLLAVKNWGSDLFMLFNINRIKPGLKNDSVRHLMQDLFAEKLEKILKLYDNLNKEEREDFILDQFIEHFKEKNYKTLKLKIEFPNQKRSSHYLLFVSKVDIAYFRMKEIMAKYSDYQLDGIPWFTVNNSATQNLFSLYSISLALRYY